MKEKFYTTFITRKDIAALYGKVSDKGEITDDKIKNLSDADMEQIAFITDCNLIEMDFWAALEDAAHEVIR